MKELRAVRACEGRPCAIVRLMNRIPTKVMLHAAWIQITLAATGTKRILPAPIAASRARWVGTEEKQHARERKNAASRVARSFHV